MRLANSIRSASFPKSGESLNAAALVWSNAPVIIGAHDAGPLIRSKNGFWLAIPTPAAGKSTRGGRITPGEWERRTGMRLRFIYRRRGPSLLVAEGRLNTLGRAVASRSKTGRASSQRRSSCWCHRSVSRSGRGHGRRDKPPVDQCSGQPLQQRGRWASGQGQQGGRQRHRSFLFQTGFSGRAEFGLIGSDDFQIKVSGDGATWFNALQLERTSGRVRAMVALQLNPNAGNPGTVADGDLWYNSSTGKFRGRHADSSVDLIGGGGSGGFAELFELQNGADFVPYLTASTDSLRRTHLQRALPPLDTDELDSLIGGIDRLFDSLFAPQVDAETIHAGPALSPAKLPSLSDGSSDRAGSDVEQMDSDEAEENGKPQDVEVRIEPRSAPASVAGTGTEATRRTLRVAAPTGRVAGKSDADPDRAADAEHWTGAFERANGRWPLAVAHLQGSRAFGCDYLRF